MFRAYKKQNDHLVVATRAFCSFIEVWQNMKICINNFSV